MSRDFVGSCDDLLHIFNVDLEEKDVSFASKFLKGNNKKAVPIFFFFLLNPASNFIANDLITLIAVSPALLFILFKTS